MSNKTYDILKELCQVWLPALGTFYFALSGIWGFPYGEQIVGTIMAFDAFLGACLHIESKKYYATLEQTKFNATEFLEMIEGVSDEGENDTTEE